MGRLASDLNHGKVSVIKCMGMETSKKVAGLCYALTLAAFWVIPGAREGNFELGNLCAVFRMHVAGCEALCPLP